MTPEEYAQARSAPEPELLKRLREETYRTRRLPQMIAGHLQGRFLSALTRLMGAKRVLEIGTFVGYSALCFAEALPPEGELITLDRDGDVEAICLRYWGESPHGKKISLRTGDALRSIATLKGPFDLVYIDADKENYANYYDAVFGMVPPGGVVLADNLLWHGRVLDPKEKDPETLALRRFAEKIRQDPRVEPLLLPIRDGLYLIRKNPGD